jgi:MFS family permease
MTAALGIRDFRCLLFAGLVSNLGSWLLVVALPYRVFQLTGSTTATGLTLAAESLPALLVGPVAGVFVDRWDRRRVMIVTDVLSAAALVGIPLADRPDRLGWLYAALVVENLGLVFFRPAARALLPALVGTGPVLVGANSLIGVVNGVVRLAGPPLGAVLLTWLGLPGLVLLDLLSYLLSAAAIAVIGHRADPGERSVRTVGAVAAELVAGLRFTAGHRTLRGLLLLGTVFCTANAVFTALLIPFMTVRFGPHPGVIGVQLSALGAGFLIGAPLAALLFRDRAPGVPLMLGLAGVGCCFGVLANAPTAVVAVLATGLAGLPASLLLITIETTLQRATPAPLRGRTSATFFAGNATAELVGALVGAGAGGTGRGPAGGWQVSVVLTVSASVILLCAAVAPVLLSVRPVGNRSQGRPDRRFAGHRPIAGEASKSPKRPGI